MEMRKILTLDAVGVIMGKVKEFVATQVAKVKDDIIGGAPATYDTLREIADYIESDGEAAAAMAAAIGTKANSEEVGAALALKANAADVYTKTEAGNLFALSENVTEATTADINAAADAVFGAIAE